MIYPPYNFAAAITTSDTVDLPKPTDAIYVGGAGNVTVVLESGNTALFTAPPVGAIIPIKAKRVNATGTTATAMLALNRG